MAGGGIVMVPFLRVAEWSKNSLGCDRGDGFGASAIMRLKGI